MPLVAGESHTRKTTSRLSPLLPPFSLWDDDEGFPRRVRGSGQGRGPFLAGCGLRAREALDALYFGRSLLSFSFRSFGGLCLGGCREPEGWTAARFRRQAADRCGADDHRASSSAHSRLALRCASPRSAPGEERMQPWACGGGEGVVKTAMGKGLTAPAGDVSCLGPGEKSWAAPLGHTQSSIAPASSPDGVRVWSTYGAVDGPSHIAHLSVLFDCCCCCCC